MEYYAGIGSRDTPIFYCNYFTKVATRLEELGYILRSGGADGADSAFERGVNSSKEIYIPWKRFNGSSSEYIVTDKKAFDLAENYHPYWHNLKDGAKKLHARNMHQILGYDLETPASFVLCYTKNGKKVGGTAQAIRVAEDYDIPIFNFGLYDFKDMKTPFAEFMKDRGVL